MFFEFRAILIKIGLYIKYMGIIDFLKDEKAMKGFLQICVIIFILMICVVLLILMFKSETYANQIIPLMTFIVGTLLGGIGGHLWSKEKK
jgi:hypothetical protein